MKELVSKPAWFVLLLLAFLAIALSFYTFSFTPLSAARTPQIHWVLFTIGSVMLFAAFVTLITPVVISRRHDKFGELRTLYLEVYKPLLAIIVHGASMEVEDDQLGAMYRMRAGPRLARPLFALRSRIHKRRLAARSRPSAVITSGDWRRERLEIAEQVKRTSIQAPIALLNLYANAEMSRWEVEHSLAHLEDHETHVTPEEYQFIDHVYKTCDRMERGLGRK